MSRTSVPPCCPRCGQSPDDLDACQRQLWTSVLALTNELARTEAEASQLRKLLDAARGTCLACSEARERMHAAEDGLSEIASIADNHPEWPAMRQIFDICSGLLPA